jgi:hypothetical protein
MSSPSLHSHHTQLHFLCNQCDQISKTEHILMAHHQTGHAWCATLSHRSCQYLIYTQPLHIHRIITCDVTPQAHQHCSKCQTHIKSSCDGSDVAPNPGVLPHCISTHLINRALISSTLGQAGTAVLFSYNMVRSFSLLAIHANS